MTIDRPPPYPAELFWSDEDEGFVALAPDLPGCSAFGETRAQALDALDLSIRAWIEAAGKAGNPVPPPSPRRPEPSHSGKLLLRLPRTLHAKLAAQAQDDGVSLNQYVAVLLAERNATHTIGKDKAGSRA